MVAREPTREELIAVARKLWGAENLVLSNRNELRFGKHGSKSLRLDKLVWQDHETGEGGGYVELYRLAGEPLPNGHDTSSAPEIVYPYRDEAGVLLFEVVRFPGHKFRQRQPNGVWSIKGVRRVIYRLPELVAADMDEFVYLPEGEKDVDNLRKLGLVATCNPGGAEKWHADYSVFLKDRHCVLLPDNDAPGRAHVAMVSASLAGVAASVVILFLPGLGPKEDVSDWIARGGDRVQLEDLARTVPVPPQPAPAATGIATGDPFADAVVAPAWLIEDIVQQGRLYGCTSLTSHGKTAVWLYNGVMIQAGQRIAGLDVVQGNVLYLAGENPEDLRLRMHGMRLDLGLKRGSLPYVLPRAFALDQAGLDHLKQEIAKLGIDLVLIIIDTAASYFPGDDDNSNVQAGNYARTLRALTEVAGNPAVVALCHPVKNAGRDSLLPRGGGAFLNELDGNLTLWSETVGETTTLSYQGKIRGPAFSPFSYRLRPIPAGLADKRGRPIETIIAEPMDDFEAATRQRQNVSNEDAVLKALHTDPTWSWAEIANFVGWTKNGKPERWKVQRALAALEKARLVRNFRGKWQVTEAGEKYLAKGSPI